MDLFVTFENDSVEKNLTLNKELARQYYQELKSLAKELDAEKKNLLELVLQIPNVISTEKSYASEEEWSKVVNAIHEAVNDLISFRIKEGYLLEKIFRENINVILSLLDQVEVFEKDRIEIIRTRLKTQLNELVSSEDYDRNRFEQEMIYYLERIDFTEEKVRLKSHCDFFTRTLKEQVSNGRRLSFISQEMGREINTLGSKANHADIQRLVVQMKDELEKIKEQLLNVL